MIEKFYLVPLKSVLVSSNITTHINSQVSEIFFTVWYLWSIIHTTIANEGLGTVLGLLVLPLRF